MRWRRSRGVLWRTAPGYLVLGTVDGRSLEIDGPGGDVWARLDRWVDEQDLTAALAREYESPETVVSRDVRSLLEALHAEGYVERSS